MSGCLPFCTEKIAQNSICQFRLIQLIFFRCTTDLFAVSIVNNDGLVVFRKSPVTYVAIKIASLACRAFRDIALLAHRLPVVFVICSVARTRSTMVRRKLNSRLRLPTMSALVRSLVFQIIPKFFCRLCTGLSFNRNICRYKLIFSAFFNNARKTLLALQFTHPTERVAIRRFPCRVPEIIYCLPDFRFAYLWPWNSMPLRPEFTEQNRINGSERHSRGNKPGLGITQPFFPSLCAGNRTDFRGKQ